MFLLSARTNVQRASDRVTATWSNEKSEHDSKTTLSFQLTVFTIVDISGQKLCLV